MIEQGKVLALNMPAGINPALARAVGVMLKNAWLQALLMSLAKMKRSPGRYFRPAVFICDEYQAFASCPAVSFEPEPRTTKLYDRTGDEISLDEVERIVI